jgi:hypothetical protein
MFSDIEKCTVKYDNILYSHESSDILSNFDPQYFTHQRQETYDMLSDCITSLSPDIDQKDFIIGYGAYIATLLLLENYYTEIGIQRLFPFKIEIPCLIEDGTSLSQSVCEYYSYALRILYNSCDIQLRSLVHTSLCFVERWSGYFYDGPKISKTALITTMMNFNHYATEKYMQQNIILSERCGKIETINESLILRLTQLESLILKTEALKTEAKKDDIIKTEALKTEAKKDDIIKTEALKTEDVKSNLPYVPRRNSGSDIVIDDKLISPRLYKINLINGESELLESSYPKLRNILDDCGC